MDSPFLRMALTGALMMPEGLCIAMRYAHFRLAHHREVVLIPPIGDRRQGGTNPGEGTGQGGARVSRAPGAPLITSGRSRPLAGSWAG